MAYLLGASAFFLLFEMAFFNAYRACASRPMLNGYNFNLHDACTAWGVRPDIAHFFDSPACKRQRESH